MQVGDKLEVQLIEIRDGGKLRVSRKPFLPEPTEEEKEEMAKRRSSSNGDGGGGRGPRPRSAPRLAPPRPRRHAPAPGVRGGRFFVGGAGSGRHPTRDEGGAADSARPASAAG